MNGTSSLRDQLAFLVEDATKYDEGDSAVAKRIAHSLRLLLHDTRHSKSLLRQLDLKKIKFLNTVEPHTQANLVSTCGLIAFKFDGPSGRRPWLVPHGDPANLPSRFELAFSDWWTMPVLVAKKKKRDILFGRSDIVLHLANQDGGSHVDEKLPRDYVELSRWNAIGVVVRRDEVGDPIPIGNPIFPCVRQISHEVLRTLHAQVPGFFTKPYSFREPIEPSVDNPGTGIPTAWSLEFVRL